MASQPQAMAGWRCSCVGAASSTRAGSRTTASIHTSGSYIFEFGCIKKSIDHQWDNSWMIIVLYVYRTLNLWLNAGKNHT